MDMNGSGHQHSKGRDSPSLQSGEETVGFAAERGGWGGGREEEGKMESGTLCGATLPV